MLQGYLTHTAHKLHHPRNLARGNTLQQKLPARRSSKKKATTFMWRFWKTFI